MENASKALLMAGGVLIALLIIGALLLMFNQISTYQQANTRIEKSTQLTAFNNEFEKYVDGKIKGVDIISLINKVVDYNKKAANGGVANSVDYNIKMSITVSNINGFRNTYSVDSGAIFKTDVINVNSSTNDFSSIINTYSNYERTYTLAVMSELASDYNEIVAKMEEGKFTELNTKKYADLIYELTGKNTTNIPSLKEIKNYKDYSSFKSSSFKSSKNPDYENGQIKNLYFEYVK